MITLIGLLVAGIWVVFRLVFSDPAAREEGPGVAQRIARPDAPASGYLGSRVCRECHADIAKQFARHPMSRSMSALPEANPVEGEPVTVSFTTHPGRRYTVERSPSEIRHHESGIDQFGDVIYDQAVDIGLALGSGRRGRSYLIEEEGRLFVSPIAWYATDDRWGLSPGYEPLEHLRFERPATDRCLHCHSGGLLREEAAAKPVRVQDRFLELSIGCERCHGPGQTHVAHHRQTDASGLDPIINIAGLDSSRRDAVCLQCHLQGETEVLRFGRNETDFRPGDHLGDIWSVYVSGNGIDPDGATAAVSHALQMHSSRCFTKSDGRLGCISCHDPHTVPIAEQRIDWYRSRCLNCHGEADCGLPSVERQRSTANGSCITCHMPALETNDVPHTAQTDHRILKNPTRPSLRDPQAFKGGIFDLTHSPLSDIEKQRADGIMLARQAELNADGEIVRQAAIHLDGLTDLFPNDLLLMDSLALLSSMGGRNEKALRLWRQATERYPDSEELLISLAMLEQQSGNGDRSLQCLERLMELNPLRAQYRLQYSMLLEKQNRIEDAFRAVKDAARLNPSDVETLEWLAKLAGRIGNPEVANQAHKTAERLGFGLQSGEAEDR